ncbi:hypothetical protein B0H17DRAFT_1203719 [Mycena rosella]|uniref:F-box domain-containing protein n=1 Tax=Mycena rosella TaxID=1033263 RepID=A0AAD7DB74_MYCRO|nr:hypothetical protein B0H17DRAFT_1203719 [Mycena rosella]
MVLTRRAHKAISRWLPNEIITEIVQLTPQSDQVSLSRVSTLFRDLCLPILYRVVRLNSLASVEAFCAAVLSNNSLAELVRSYTVVDFFGVQSPSLVGLVRLEDLSLHHSLADTDLRDLLGLIFPHLVRCRLRTATLESGPRYAYPSAEKQDALMSFLLRHPALENLHIEDPYHKEVWSSQSARIPLLHLQRLQCPARIVPSIDTTNLRRARLCWNTGIFGPLGPAQVENIVVSLRSMAHSDIPFGCSNDHCDSCLPAVVDSLSRNMPATRTLLLHVSYELNQVRCFS